jgi:hypothetical protein
VALAQSQIGSGDIRGMVVDPAGGAIAKAKVSIAAEDRGLTRAAETDGEGEFRFALLPPGTYRIRTEAAGFTTKIIGGAEVHVGQVLIVRIAMEVGAVTTEVTVAAEPPVTETERTQQATSID